MMDNSNRNRVLGLYNILTKYSDEKHQLTMKQILDYMEQEGLGCSADSIARYMNQLRNEFGVDIISSMGRNASYFIGERMLQKAELKLLIDAINASNFVERKTAKRICDKLKDTVSIHEQCELDRNVMGLSNTKTENTTILYNVDSIQDAFNKKQQIEFDYLAWSKDKKLVDKDKSYVLNPWALIWANGRYYLYGYNDENGVLVERHYRVDKMRNVETNGISRSGSEQFKKFDPNAYVSKRIGMFSGQEEKIVVKIDDSLVGAFIDQFGKGIDIKDSEENNKLIVTFEVVVTELLLGWFIGLGNVEVLKPDLVREKMINLIKLNMKRYGDG